MRPTTSLRSRVLAVLALALAAACADSSNQPTAPDGRRLHADLIVAATGSTDSTGASADSTAAGADSVVVDSTSAGATTATSTDTTSAGAAGADTTSAPADTTTVVVASSDTATTTPTTSTDTTGGTTTPTDTTTTVVAAPIDGESDDLLARRTFLTPQPLVCPSDEQVSDQAVIGPEGGTIGVRGTSITIPAGAVSEPTLFEVILPASQYMETEIHAVGSQHFFFAQPATITINYSRCAAGAVPETARAQGAYIDSGTKKILELMGGEFDRAARKVTFSTGHLSGYVVAF